MSSEIRAVQSEAVEVERRLLTEVEEAAIGAVVEHVREGKGMGELFGVESEAVDMLEAQAYRFYSNQRYEQAKVVARGILSLEKERPLSLLILGDVALAEFRFGEAVEHLEKAYGLAPEAVELRARLGEALLKNGQAEKARPHLEAALKGLEDGKGVTAQRTRAFLEHMRR